MKLSQTTTKREWLTYGLVWLFMFLLPLVSLSIHANLDDNITFRFRDVLHIWYVQTVMLVAFLIHNFWLAPMLLYKRKLRLYLLSIAALLALSALLECAHRPPRPLPGPPASVETVDPSMPPPPPDGKYGPGKPRGVRISPFDPEQVFSLMLLLIVFGANLGLKHIFKSVDEERRQQKMEKEGLKQELTYLKHQMNPHFFMNTLNNIHALVDIEPQKAKSCIVELSHMMRYMLYECNKDTIALSRGIQMMKSHIDLMRIRYDDKIDIRLDAPQDLPSVELPPLIIIPFVENAFKHGISYAEDSYIHIAINVHDDVFQLVCDNSKHAGDTEHGGVGLRNVIKRLDLIYGDQYSLDIDDQPDHYHVTLRVPIVKSPT